MSVELFRYRGAANVDELRSNRAVSPSGFQAAPAARSKAVGGEHWVFISVWARAFSDRYTERSALGSSEPRIAVFALRRLLDICVFPGRRYLLPFPPARIYAQLRELIEELTVERLTELERPLKQSTSKQPGMAIVPFTAKLTKLWGGLSLACWLLNFGGMDKTRWMSPECSGISKARTFFRKFGPIRPFGISL